jgi:hypothetical protein
MRYLIVLISLMFCFSIVEARGSGAHKGGFKKSSVKIAHVGKVGKVSGVTSTPAVSKAPFNPTAFLASKGGK